MKEGDFDLFELFRNSQTPRLVCPRVADLLTIAHLSCQVTDSVLVSFNELDLLQVDFAGLLLG